MKILNYSASDIIYASIAVGNMPSHKSVSYINEVKNSLKQFFPENKVLAIADRNIQAGSVDITILQKNNK